MTVNYSFFMLIKLSLTDVIYLHIYCEGKNNNKFRSHVHFNHNQTKYISVPVILFAQCLHKMLFNEIVKLI